jgi:hypothetical protein
MTKSPFDSPVPEAVEDHLQSGTLDPSPLHVNLFAVFHSLSIRILIPDRMFSASALADFLVPCLQRGSHFLVGEMSSPIEFLVHNAPYTAVSSDQ